MNPNTKFYFASGGNDNKVFVWDLRKNQIISTIREHSAAVRALKWNPMKSNTLISAGGEEDKRIVIWNEN